MAQPAFAVAAVTRVQARRQHSTAQVLGLRVTVSAELDQWLANAIQGWRAQWRRDAS